MPSRSIDELTTYSIAPPYPVEPRRHYGEDWQPKPLPGVLPMFYMKWTGYDKEEVIVFFARHAKDYREGHPIPGRVHLQLRGSRKTTRCTYAER